MCVLGEGHVQVCHMHMWRLEVNLLELVLSFSPVGPKDQSQVLRTISKYLYPMSNSDNYFKAFATLYLPIFYFFKTLVVGF